MFTLPNGVVVFNATPHPITFQCPACAGREPGTSCRVCQDTGVLIAPVDKIINATVSETVAKIILQSGIELDGTDVPVFTLVTPSFERNDEGRAVIAGAKYDGAHLVVGSIIAAQAYPGQVVAMVPALGFERVPPDQKRMRTDKFTVFS